MLLQDAIKLIQNKAINDEAGEWADLGCGSGTFTYALANILLPGSVIHAVDRQPVILLEKANPNNISIRGSQLDFVKDPLPFQQLNGILMANSLHYVEDKKPFLEKIKRSLKNNGHLLIVEYDTPNSNQWVPYPVDFISLEKLMIENGFSPPIKLNERPSSFGRTNMYAGLTGLN